MADEGHGFQAECNVCGWKSSIYETAHEAEEAAAEHKGYCD